ncbi:MAG TPA: serine/threonine-protein kinase [Kofleriaceae bacterium]|nr:serine/threonine-protein kinase [Kofleriaceae bacterium]
MTDTWQHTHVGRFRVEGVLGRGGMGVVLRAFDPHLQRPVAIKVLTERKATVRAGTTVNLRERVDQDGLLDEARALAQITDPNVLAVHEIGNELGQTFLVMELVEGVDLRQWLAAAPRSLGDIYQVFAQAGRGLAAAHRRGIIHRDFKPENVLISADGRVRVCDFGIAAFARASELIHTGTAGTPRYMAPELWRDQGASVQSDVYAFAATLVEAIVGELPADLAIIDRELARRGVHPRLRTVLVRSLDPDAANRPAQLDDLMRAFATRKRATWRMMLVIAAAAIVIGIVAITLVMRQSDRAAGVCNDSAELVAARWNDAERQAVRRGIIATHARESDADDIVARLDEYARSWQRLRDETCSDKVAEAQRPARLACLDRRLYDLTAVVRALYRTPSRDLAFGRSASLPDLGSCIEATEIRLPASAGTRAAIEDLTAKVVELYDQGLAHLGSRAELAELETVRAQALALGDIELAVRIDRVRGQLLANATHLEEAQRVLDDGAQLAMEHHQDVVAGLALVEGAAVSRIRNDLGAAESKLRIAKSQIERSPDATPYSRMRLYRELSNVAAIRGNMPEAHKQLQLASDAVASMQPRDPLWTVQLVMARAELLDAEGKLSEALVAAREAEQQLRALGSQGVVELSNALRVIGDLERQRGNLDVTQKVFEERVALLERTMPPDNSARVYAEGMVGNFLIDRGQFEAARDSFKRTLDRIESTPALADVHTDFLGNLARAERLLGNFERARVLEQTALDEERHAGRPMPIAFHEISYTYLELEAGDFRQAALHAGVAEELLANDPADTVNRLDLADTQIAIALGEDKPEVADKIATRVLALFEERKIDDARNERFWIAAATARSLHGGGADARDLAQRALDRRLARKADPLDIAVAEVAVAIATYTQSHAPTALATLRKHFITLADPRTRIEHAQLSRWFAANHLQP